MTIDAIDCVLSVTSDEVQRFSEVSRCSVTSYANNLLPILMKKRSCQEDRDLGLVNIRL